MSDLETQEQTAMSQPKHPQPKQPSAGETAKPDSETGELTKSELDTVSGGKGCASGEHIKEATITVRP